MIGIPKKLQIRQCLFELEVTEGMANIKFPCSFFIEWKTANGKHHIKSTNRVKAVKGIIPFQQRLNLEVLMIYDLKHQNYRRKEAIILVNLLSNSRPNDPKLVGRVEVDLANIANGSIIQELKTHPLKYCSVEGSLTFKMVIRQQKSTSMDVGQLERSDLTQNDSHVPDNQVNKEDMKSQSSSSLLGKYKERVASKINEVSLQERLAKLKNERQEFHLGKTPLSSRQKRDQIISKNEEKEIYSVSGQPHNDVIQVKEEKKLVTDLSVPMLAKNTSQFNSPQVSQKKLKTDHSQQGERDKAKDESTINQFKNIEDIKYKEMQNDIFGAKLYKVDKQESIVHLQGITIQLKQAPPSKEGDGIVELNKNQKDLNPKSQEINNKHQPQRSVNGCQTLIKLETDLKEKQELLLKQQQIISLNRQEITKLKMIFQESQSLKLKNQEQIAFYQLQLKQLRETQSNLQSAKLLIENQFTMKIQALNQKVEQLTLQNRQLKLQVQSNMKKPKQRILTSEVNIIDYEQKLQQLSHRCESQQKNHENTKLELNQLREWYNELQELNQKLNLQKYHTDKQLAELKLQFTKITQNLNEKIQQLSRLTNNLIVKQQENTKLNDEYHKIESQLQQTKLELANKLEQLQIVKQQLSLEQQESSKSKSNQNLFNKQIQEIQRQLQEKQLCLQSIVQDLKQEKQKTIQLQAIITDTTKNNHNIIKSKQEAVEDTKNRLNDLVNRLKQKQQLIARKQRQNEQLQAKFRQNQFSTEQYKQKIKGLEGEKIASIDKIKQLERQTKNLQKQLIQNKQIIERNTQSYNTMIIKLKQSLEQQISQKRQLQKKCDQIRLNAKNGENKTIEQLQIKLQSYREKQHILKQNLLIVQRQLNKLAISQQQRQEQQEQYRQLILGLTHNNSQLSNKNGQLQNELVLICERSEALQAEVQLLNAYMPEEQNKQELLEINQRLNDKNKQLLNIIEAKNAEIAELERKRGEATYNETQHEMSNSRTQRERRELQQRIIIQAQQNEHLQRQFERLSNKYEQELNMSEKINQQKINTLIITINGLNLKVKQYEQRKGLNQQQDNNQRLLSQEKIQKLEQTLREKDYQLQFFTAQIKELNQTIEGLNSQLAVLNNQYQNIYSEFGEKEFQLYEACSKVKDLEEIINNKQQNNQKQAIQGVRDEFKAKLELYQAQIKSFKQKEYAKDKDCRELQEKVGQLQLLLGKQDQLCQTLTQTVESLETHQKENKGIISEKQKRIQQLENIVSKKDQEYKKISEEISTLKIDLLTVKNESEFSKEQNQKQENKVELIKQDTSKKSTPIHLFKHYTSPSPSLNKGVNLIEVVQQINTIMQKRKKQQEVQTVLRLVIDNNARQEEEFQRWSQERGVIQEKAKMASKEIQKAKSAIMKGTSRSIAEKTQITALLRPIEAVIGQLVNLSQTLSQIDIEMQQQQQQPKEQITA